MPTEPVPVIAADWQAPKHVQAFNTTRQGGVSQAPFDSLNLGLHVNDDPTAVRENRQRLMLSQAIPAEPRWLNQVHGCRVLDVTAVSADSANSAKTAPSTVGTGSNGGSVPPEADAAFTRDTDQVLCVVTADCLPVAITNESGTELAVAHAGWKGLANGVLEACLQKFSPDEALHVWLGPAIGADAFEVGNEVMEAFVSKDDALRASFSEHSTTPDKKYADIYALARRIIESNLSSQQRACEFSGGQWCTVTDSMRFHSYRRDGARSGRMALVAWLASQE